MFARLREPSRSPKRLPLSHAPRLAALLFICPLFCLVGCEPNGDDVPSQSTASVTSEPATVEPVASDPVASEPATDPIDEPTSAPVKLEFGTWQEIEKLATTSAQVTVVDLWSLSCAPCLKEFPGLVRLSAQHGENVRCIGVDVDYDGRKTRPPETYQEPVADFLRSVDADFTNFVCTTPSDDIYRLVDIDSIPTVLIYGADGKLVREFVDAGETAGFTYENDVVPLVRSLLE